VGLALRVLLVEDEHWIRLLAAEALRDEGFDVEEASSGDEAALLLVGALFFDVLFTDVQMPGAFTSRCTPESITPRLS
jgi:CheY-like chemotaxis protein